MIQLLELWILAFLLPDAELDSDFIAYFQSYDRLPRNVHL